MNEYRTVCLDEDRCSVAGYSYFTNLKKAKQHAKRIATDKEFIAAGVVKVEVQDHKREVLCEYWTENYEA